MNNLPCARYSDTEIAQMHLQFLAGDTTIGWELVLSKLPVIKKLCSKRAGYCGSELDDLVQEYLLVVYEALEHFKPAELPLNLFICQVVEGGANRIMRTCRKMAGLPLSQEACGKLKREPLGDVHSESSYEEILAMYDELKEAVEIAELPDNNILALNLLAHGANRKDIQEQLGIGRVKCEKLIAESIAKLQVVLGTTGTARSLSHAELERSQMESVVRLALSQDLSPRKAAEEMTRRGLRVSYGLTYRLWKDHSIYERRAKVTAGEPIEQHIREVLEAKLKPTAKEMPKLPEFTGVSDELWAKIKHLIPETTGKTKPRLNTEVVIYRAVNGLVPFRDLPYTGIHWDVAWRWERKLKELGVYDQIVELGSNAKEYMPESLGDLQDAVGSVKVDSENLTAG